MLIFCGGMLRSGSTLQYQLASRIVELRGIGKRVTWYGPSELAEVIKTYIPVEDYVVFKTHALNSTIIELFEEETARGLYIYRDIRDVVVSVMRKDCKGFEEVFPATIISALSLFAQWTSQVQVMVSRYEDVIEDIETETTRIAKHLGIPLSISEAKLIASEHTLERQKERIQEARSDPSRLITNNDTTFDSWSLLHLNHITSGRVGEWKHILTSEQICLIENIAEEWLDKQGYQQSTHSLQDATR